MSKKKPTTSEKAHMGRVARLPCVVCKETLGLETFGVQVHHIRDGQGMGERASNWLTVPLCQYHHTGSGGVHGLGVRGFYTRYKLDELDLLSMTIQWLMEAEYA